MVISLVFLHTTEKAIREYSVTMGIFISSSVSFLVCVALLLLSRSVLKHVTVSRISRKQGCQSPVSLPQKDPFFGLDLVYAQIFQSHKLRSLNAHLQNLFHIYGHTFQAKPFGNKEIFTISPRNIQAVYATDFESFGVGPFRNFVFKPLLGDGVMTTDGSIWKHSRAIIAPTFVRAQVEDLSAFDVHVRRLLDVIPKDNSMIDLQPLFQRLALDSTTEFLFGESVKSLAPDTPADAQAFLDAYNYAQRGVGKRMMLPFWNIFTRDKKFWESCRVAQTFVDSVVSRSIRQCASYKLLGSQNYILAYELAKENIDPATMREQLLNVFLPAHDAIAIPLTNIFFVLARHPEVWAKLRREILAAGLLNPAPAQLKSLRYLQCVISETLRLYPGVSTNERVALTDTVLPTGGGAQGDRPIFVKKGNRVTISFYALQRRKDLWGEDAEEFRPERWENLKYGFWTNLPFGGGPRVCPGQERGWIEVAYTVVKMVTVFKEIRNQDPMEMFEDFHRVVTVSKNGAKVALVPS